MLLFLVDYLLPTTCFKWILMPVETSYSGSCSSYEALNSIQGSSMQILVSAQSLCNSEVAAS